MDKPWDTALLQAEWHVTFLLIGALRDNYFPQIATSWREYLHMQRNLWRKEGPYAA